MFNLQQTMFKNGILIGNSQGFPLSFIDAKFLISTEIGQDRRHLMQKSPPHVEFCFYAM